MFLEDLFLFFFVYDFVTNLRDFEKNKVIYNKYKVTIVTKSKYDALA